MGLVLSACYIHCSLSSENGVASADISWFHKRKLVTAVQDGFQERLWAQPTFQTPLMVGASCLQMVLSVEAKFWNACLLMQ